MFAVIMSWCPTGPHLRDPAKKSAGRTDSLFIKIGHVASLLYTVLKIYCS